MSLTFDLIDAETQNVVFTSTNVAEVNARAAEWKAAGKKVRIQKNSALRDATEWHRREQEKMDSGHYKLLPLSWRTENWFIRGTEETKHHYPHISKDGEMVAYTPNDDFGFDNRQTVLSPSRYLAKFYGNILRSEVISKLSNSFLMERYTVKFYKTAEDFSILYQQPNMKNPSSGAESCMGYPIHHFGTGKHPAEAYAAGDLQMAVIHNPDSEKQILARALVWPERRAMNRCYGVDERMRDILANLLGQAGYFAHNSFEGAKIAAIRLNSIHGRPARPTKGNEYFLMPYIDGEYSAVVWAEDNKHFNLVSRASRKNNPIVCQHTQGYVMVPRKLRENEFRCVNCTEVSENPVSVIVALNDAGTNQAEQNWCRDCAQTNAFHCRITDTHRSGFPSDDVLISANPPIRVTGWIDSEFVAECYRTGEFFDTRVFGPLVRVVNAAGNVIDICSAFRVETDKDYVAPMEASTRRTSAPVFTTTYDLEIIPDRVVFNTNPSLLRINRR